MVDSTDERQCAQPRIRNGLQACLGETAGAEEAIRAIVEQADRRVDLTRDSERVVPPSHSLNGRDQGRLASRVVHRAERVEQRGPDISMSIQPRERRSEPFAVRRVPALEQEAEADELTHEPRCQNARTQFVAHLRGPTDEGFFLVDAPPLTREQPEPDLVGIPRERHPHRLELAEPVVEDRSLRDAEQSLLGRDEPVSRRNPRTCVEAELVFEPAAEGTDVDVMGDRHRVPPEPCRPTPEPIRQAGGDALLDAQDVRLVDEHLETRSPPMVGRPIRVEAEDVRSPPEQRC